MSKKIIKLLKVAEAIAKLSKDSQTKVGTLLVDPTDFAILALSYNGFVRKAPDYLLPKTRPKKYEYIIHAELNLIINCARHGITTKDKIIISTHSPCSNCVRMCYNSGITHIIFKKPYKDYAKILNLQDVKVVEKKTPYYTIITLQQKESG